jgi:23S rRNA (uracil1939-C5)-methyltransferase
MASGAVNEIEAQLAPSLQSGRIDIGGKLAKRFGEIGEHRTLGGFSQVNAGVNEKLIARVLEIAAEVNATTATDLYAGAGNFAIPLAQNGLQTVAVELERALVRAGRRAATDLDLFERVSFREMPVEKYLWGKPVPSDLIIADPPRTGLGKLTDSLNFAPHLILLSCDLASGVRDLKSLLKDGWELVRIEPFDMFAQTGHVELLSLLKRAII